MIVIVHGPMASGKTFHKQAFAKLFCCSHIVDDWQPTIHETPDDGRLVLTNYAMDEIHRALRLDRPDAAIRIIDIKTARAAIGFEPYAPGRTERATL
ncbi:hypothetical protein SAMN02927924_02788 [Sphingobium faniae]|nr:hypothetical protein SAMN02927924_02788 [Sphingobium faniae]